MKRSLPRLAAARSAWALAAWALAAWALAAWALAAVALAVVVILQFTGRDTAPDVLEPPPHRSGGAASPVDDRVPPPAKPPATATPETPPSRAVVPRPPARRPPRSVLQIGWVGARPASDRRLEREIRLEPPPFPRLPRSRPLLRDIRLTGGSATRMQIRTGSPLGLETFPPRGPDGRRFRLIDAFAAAGPRVLRFLLDGKALSFADRFLEAGSGPAAFRIGPAGTITGRITGAAGQPIPGVAVADGVRAQADFNGDFVLDGIRAGRAVVYVNATVPGHAVRRCLLPSPGGPYTIRLARGADLHLRIEKPVGWTDEGPPLWACAVPAETSVIPEPFAAETAYHRESRGSEFVFHNLPLTWSGTVVLWHPRAAAALITVNSLPGNALFHRLQRRATLTATVLDAETSEPIPAARVTTSADDTTLHDLALARRRVSAPSETRRQPLPYLGMRIGRINALS